MRRVGHNQAGIAHLVLIVLVVVVLGGIGAAGYIVMSKNKKAAPEAAASAAVTAAAKEECKKLNDKDLCKFLTSWKTSKKYRMTSTTGGQKSVFELDGEKSHVSISGDVAYEVITIDKTTYTKSGSVWYKQTIKDPDEDVSKDYKQDFKEPADDTTTETTEDKTTYKSLGKEACGSLTCFKYEIVDPSNTDSKEFIWFDSKDYQLRKTRSETKDGVTEATYEYSNVTVSVPSPVKELGANQYIVPGQTEPQTLPSAADYDIGQ